MKLSKLSKNNFLTISEVVTHSSPSFELSIYD